MSKKLITEFDVVEIARSGSKVLRVDAETILTPSAKDAVLQHGIQIVHAGETPQPVGRTVAAPAIYRPGTDKPAKTGGTVVIGSDHGGYRLKETLRQFLVEGGYTVIDVGTDSEEACDYPDFAFAVARLVGSGEAVRGIMIDGVGVASAIVANKVPGIRAVPCYDELVARSSREHNNANVLTLGGRIIGAELAKSIVRIWLDTEFAGGRHEGRVAKIGDIEKRYTKDR
jgi:ribose 5-phosphate isomerase B